MSPLQRFLANARFSGLVKCIMLGVMVYLAMGADARQGRWAPSTIILVVSLALGLSVRRWLVGHVLPALFILNGLLLLALVAVLAGLKTTATASEVLRYAGVGLIGLHLGGYIGLMTHPKVKIGGRKED